MRLAVVLPTCNRPALFERLITDLGRELDGQINTLVIYEDGAGLVSQPRQGPYNRSFPMPGGVVNYGYIRSGRRAGKEGYWKVVTRLLQHAKMTRDSWDTLLFLADDLHLPAGFGPELAMAWAHTQDANRRQAGVVLNVLADQRTGRAQWGFVPVEVLPGLCRGWFDGAGLIDKHALDVLGWRILEIPRRRWQTAPHLGSGVWQQACVAWQRGRVGIYQVQESLVVHDAETPSVMNPEARAVMPLGTNRRPS